MDDYPPHVTNILHLLTPSDVDLESGSAQLIGPDGQTIEVSAQLWAAVEQLVDCARHNMNPWVVPIDTRLGIERAAAMFAMSNDEMRTLLENAETPLTRDALGDTALTEDIVAVTNRERARRHAAYLEYLDASEAERWDLDDDET